jgi:hypothetical protein
MTFKADERIRETSTTTGTGTYTLAGAPTGFQPVSSIGANNYGPFFISDGTNWEAIIGQYLSGPDRLARDAVLASSNADAAVNWGAGTRTIRCGWPAWMALPRQLATSAAGTGTKVLTQNEQRRRILYFDGALTGNRIVEVDNTIGPYIVWNNTTGDFSFTFQVTGASGVTVPRGASLNLYCDGNNIIETTVARVLSRFALTGEISPAQITANQNDYNPASLLQAAVLRLSSDASRNITGLAGGEDGRVLILENVGSNPIVLTHDDAASTAANRILIGESTFTLASNRAVTLWYDATSSRWRRFDGQQAASDTVSGGLEIAVQSEMETGSDNTRAVVPGRQHFHPSAAKFWLKCDTAAAIQASYNITSVTDTGTGDLGVTIATDFSSANYAVVHGYLHTGASRTGAITGGTQAAGSFQWETRDLAGVVADPTNYFFAGFGDQ